ncbi:glycerol kinase [Mycena sp. CBHHK59/15]|nr:glycerol kinase [Mycena sp. CBHHK59/15]
MSKHGEFVGSLDCGTTSVRFIIFNQYADIIAQCQLEFPQYYPHPGWHDHDATEIQEHADKSIAEAVKEMVAAGWAADSIKVIGITNQRETAVAWSRKTGKPLCKAIVWTDSRTKNTVAHFEHKLQETGIEVAPGQWRKGKDGVEALRDITGLPLSTYFSAIKLRWMIDNYPDVAAAHEAMTSSSKNIHLSEVTNASRTLLLNTTTLQWEPSLLVSTSEVYGNIAAGPLAGVPVGGLVGDQQGALIGNKCLKQGEAKCTYGTGAFLLFCTAIAYQAGPDAKPVYALEGSIAVAGSAIKWLRDSMALIQSAGDVNDLAAKEPTRAAYTLSRPGILIGISQYTNPSHIARATLEANAYQTRAIIESMLLDSGAALKHLKVDGGMTNGDIAMTILADVGGFTVDRAGERTVGGERDQMFGWDLTKPETLAEVNTKGSREFVPQMEEGARKKGWEGWQRAVERSKGWEEGVDE